MAKNEQLDFSGYIEDYQPEKGNAAPYAAWISTYPNKPLQTDILKGKTCYFITASYEVAQVMSIACFCSSYLALTDIDDLVCETFFIVERWPYHSSLITQRSYRHE